LCIDYVQLVDGDKKTLESEYARTSEVSRELKRLALHHNMPVIVLSQLNRNSTQRSNQDYTLSDIRSTGQIAQDADVVLFLMPESWDNKEDMRRRLKIAKNRHGRNETTVNLIFFPQQSRFAILEGGANA
jgi:replicative DNA helicase